MDILNYEILENEITQWMDRTHLMVLATCAATDAQHQVSARMMSVIHDGLKIYFQTGRDSGKCAQMLANPCVALCADNVQIEGTARLLGHPLAAENQFFAEQSQVLHRGSFDKYSHLSDNVVVEVIPTHITLWKYTADGTPYRDYLNVTAHTASREIYPLE